MVECKICNRSFKSKNSAIQHERDAHSKKRSSPPGRRRGVRRVRNARIPGSSGLDINPSRSGRVPGGVVTLSGEDRVGLYTVTKSGSTFLKLPISVGASPRLQTMARAFERIRWVSVSFIVTPQAPLTVAGGYVAGFIMDPDDGAATAAQLSASQGSATRKWFESSVLQMPQKPDLLYTSSSEELRFSSPGNFWIISEGNPSQDISVVVTMRWRVHLSIPTIESVNDGSFTSSGAVVPVPGNYYLGLKKGASTTYDFSQFVPETLRSGSSNHFFRVPTFNIEYSEGSGDTGTIQAHFFVYNASDKRGYASSDGLNKIDTAWQSNVEIQTLIPCDTPFKYVGTGNACKAGQHSLPQFLSPTLEKLFSQFLRIQVDNSQSLKRSQSVSSNDSMQSTSPFELVPPSMAL